MRANVAIFNQANLFSVLPTLLIQLTTWIPQLASELLRGKSIRAHPSNIADDGLLLPLYLHRLRFAQYSQQDLLSSIPL